MMRENQKTPLVNPLANVFENKFNTCTSLHLFQQHLLRVQHMVSESEVS
jgi:hypothetical protein